MQDARFRMNDTLTTAAPSQATGYASAFTADTRREAVRQDPARLAAVRATGLMDTEVEEVFDRLTRLGVRLLKIPAAFISLVDSNRDFYKSACGFGEPLASTRELAGLTFCHYTVQGDTPLVIPDTAADPVYSQVPTVKTLGVAAYVGVPLVIGGHSVGALCAIDVKPHAWTADEVETLVELAASAQREIELRGALAEGAASLARLEGQRVELERANQILQEQAVELEMQSEELQMTAAHLEQRTEEAEGANHAKTQFLSMMSHELRTPLNAITGYAQLINMGVRGPVTAEQRDFLDRIERASRHLQTLIGDILEFARFYVGKVQFELERLPVSAVIEESVELLAPQISERGIEFSHETGDACDVYVRADRSRVRQILVNLLGNAIKFTPDSGRVWLSCGRLGVEMHLDVSDTGRGIPADKLAAVFEPFVQVDRAGVAPAMQGVGLGLAICRELARGMGGDVRVASEEGKGSTFTLVLPMLAGGPQDAGSSE
jgi:signal transduction histidine kinase